MDERDERAAAVAEPVARLVLMAMARFTNPNRDQVYGPTREWRCWASVATIAEMAGASERQVQRVLRVFEREGYIDRIDQGQRPGRPRKGEEPGRAKPSTWCLRPDQWRRRALTNRTGVVAISSDRRNSLPVPEDIPSVPVGLPRNQTGTGHGGTEIVPVSSPEPGTPGTHNETEPENKPARSAMRATDEEEKSDFKDRKESTGHQRSLFAAVVVTPAAPVEPTDSMTCYGCQVTVDTIDYKRQHDPDCEYVGLYPFEIRSRRAMLNERAKRERARAEARELDRAEEMARLDEL